MSLEQFKDAVTYHEERPPTFDIIGRSPNPATQKHSNKILDSFNINHDSSPNQHQCLYDTEQMQNISSINGIYASVHKRKNSMKQHPFIDDGNPLYVMPKSKQLTHDNSFYDPLLEEWVLPNGYALRVTLVWCTGTDIIRRSNVNKSRTDETKLEDWLGRPTQPHVIILGN